MSKNIELMTKQETIQKAYGDYFEQMKPWIDENGWFNKNAFYQKDFGFKYEEIGILFSHFDELMIPTSIVGIEDNNGWHDLPTKEFLEYGFYFVKIKHPETLIEEIFVHEIKDGAGIIPYQYAIQYKKIELKLPLYYGL